MNDEFSVDKIPNSGLYTFMRKAYDKILESGLLRQAEYLRMLRDLGEEELYFKWEPILREKKKQTAVPKVNSATPTAKSADERSAVQGSSGDSHTTEKARIIKPVGSIIQKPEMPDQTFKLPDIKVDDKAKALSEHFEGIKDCDKCRLHKGRGKLVYGGGNPDADILFIGEAPGAEEDKTGEPFVGRAGGLLDKILAAMTLSRDDVYIANIIKCRPPNNRDPQPDETALCVKYLLHQIAVIDPKLIIFLGRISAQNMLGTTDSMRNLRKSWHTFLGRPAVVTYHPAALLYNASYKRPVWEDMKKVMTYLEIPVP